MFFWNYLEIAKALITSKFGYVFYVAQLAKKRRFDPHKYYWSIFVFEILFLGVLYAKKEFYMNLNLNLPN